MVSFERAFVTSYRLSIVTFPMSLRVSEILPRLCYQHAIFPTPPLVSPKFPHVPWEQVDGIWANDEQCVGLIVCNLVSKISNLCGPDPPTSQTDGQTDGRHAIAIPRFAL